jgi:hypothetical protein
MTLYLDMKYFQKHDNLNMKFDKKDLLDIEIEYQRYISHHNLLQDIYTLLNLKYNTKLYGKAYECKNILDRFIIECINDGYINYVDSIKQYLYLNNNITNHYLNQQDYFLKMINEIKEKRIYLDINKQNKLEQIILKHHKQFQENIKIIDFKSRVYCNVKYENDNITIIYKNYKRVINLSRFISLLKNYRKPTYVEFIQMIIRNSIFDNSHQQWSIGINVYNYINQNFDIDCELFASPLNFNLPRYCSIFPDIENTFGSICNFYQLNGEIIQNKNITGAIYNPPYIPYLMDESIDQCLELLNELKSNKFNMSIICFLPHWSDADYIKKIKESEHTIDYQIFKKGSYMLHEKDTNKQILGSFELIVLLLFNSTDSNHVIEIKKEFKDLITIIKNEVIEYKKN